MKIKRNFVTRCLAMLLCIVMIVNSLSLEAIAADETATAGSAGAVSDLDEAVPVLDDAEELETVPEAHIVAEVEEERTETTKTFRMSDGSYAMAVYDQPVHYESDEGAFEEIDNTFALEENASGDAALLSENTAQTERTYTNRAGRNKISFTQKTAPFTEAGLTLWGNASADAQNSAVNEDPLSTTSMEVAGQTVSWFYEGMASGSIMWESGSSESQLTGDEAFLTVSDANSKGIYYNAFPYTDLEYLVSSEGIKENIILKSREAENVWTLKADIGTLTAEQKDAQTVVLYEEETPVMTIAAPEMVDAENKISTDITMDMELSDSMLSLTITADEEFLQSEDTVYPVTVDPYFYVIASSEIQISDTFLSENLPSQNMRQDGMAVGSLMVGEETSVYGTTRSLLKLDTLPQLPAGSVITDAQLILKNYYSYSANNSMTVEVRRAQKAWEAKSATWNSSRQAYEGEAVSVIEDYYIVPQDESPEDLFDTWDITRLMKGWYEGTYANNGVMLMAPEAENTSPARCTKYYSSNCPTYEGLYPTFLIEFRNNEGLEEYWTYHEQSVNGGTAYINDYSGNLVFEVPIAETTGANMPVDIGFVYNSSGSNQYYQNNTKGTINGMGWKTTYSQRLDLVKNVTQYSGIADELIEEGFEYVWLDGDGTHHFFQKIEDGVYMDEDGLGLTMKTGQSYGAYTNLNIIEDKDGNKLAFMTNGYLRLIGNHLNQKISFSYNGANLAAIIDGAGRQLTFGYDGNAIVSITGPDGTVKFKYSGTNLTLITFPDNTTMQFAYSPVSIGSAPNNVTYHLLSTVTGRDGNKLTYTYETSDSVQQKCRVKSVTEYASDGTAGNSISMDYSRQNLTEFTYKKTSGEIKEIYQFNNWGNTTGIIDHDGSSAEVQYNTFDTTSATSTQLATNHKITKVGAGTKFVDNLLINHSGETGSSWAQSEWMPAEATFAFDTANAYLGNRSFKVTQNDATPRRCGWKQTVSITGGATYTFSAYVKTEDIPNGSTGATLFAVAVNGTTELGTIECDTQLTGDNDWKRISMTFTAPANADTLWVYGGLRYVNGTAWFDCFQLEQNDAVSPYNMVENSSLTRTDSWTCVRTASTEGLKETAIKFVGNPEVLKTVYQRIYVGKAGTAFHVSSLANATAIPDRDAGDQTGRFGLNLAIFYADGTAEWTYNACNHDVTGRQYASFTVAPRQGSEEKVISHIEIYTMYYGQANIAYFDNVMITVDEAGTTYAYDSDGNLISSKDNAQRQTTYTIDSATDMVTTATDSTDTVYSYTYDSTNTKQLKTAKENSTGVGFEYTYGSGNNADNVTKVQMGTVGAMTSNPYIETGVTYTDNGAYVTSESDQRGKVTSYDVDTSTGQINSVTDPKGNVTGYTYNTTTKNLTKVSSGDAAVTYGYSDASLGNRLTSITSGGATYNFIYDKWSNLQSVNVGGTYNLVTNTYASANGNLTKTEYGNDQSLFYEYDEYDRVIAVDDTDADPATAPLTKYTYNAEGQLARIEEKNGSKTEYVYDIAGRVTDYVTTQGKLSYSYDNLDRTADTTTAFNGIEITTAYGYLSANRPGVTTLPEGKVDRTYDSLQRETVHQTYADASSTTHLRAEIGYKGVSGNRTTELVGNYNNYVGISASDKNVVDGYTSFTYYYDDNGNINRVTAKDGGSLWTKTYSYDSLNQLIREQDAKRNRVYTYSYDNQGNILSKSEYYSPSTGTEEEPLNTITYTYGDSVWKDRLTGYKNGTITYDAIGNPVRYYDGRTFTWEQGRRLKASTLADETRVSYQYNSDGIRTQKTVGSTTTTYLVDDAGTIQALREGNETLIFMYDSTGRREGFIWYTGTVKNGVYYYLYNGQNDIIGILASDLTPVVSYEYDSWGKLLSTSGTQASTVGRLNPFRYRGYCYDEETGFYYLNSRYYDPEVGRFISADDVEYLGANGSIVSYNLYAYCENNPVNMIDTDGHAAIHFAFAAIGGIVGWKLGDYVAKKLGCRSEKKYWAIRVGVTIGGAAIGWFSARLMTRILTGYLRSNPSLIFKMSSKWGVSKFNSVMNFLGINPFKLSMNSSKFIGIARLYNNKSVTLGYNWAISLYNKAKSLGFKVMLDKPHGGYGWHIHLSGANGKLSNLHIQISKSAWNYLSKLIK